MYKPQLRRRSRNENQRNNRQLCQRRYKNENKQLRKLRTRTAKLDNRAIQVVGTPHENKTIYEEKIIFNTPDNTWNCRKCGRKHQTQDIQNAIQHACIHGRKQMKGNRWYGNNKRLNKKNITASGYKH